MIPNYVQQVLDDLCELLPGLDSGLRQLYALLVLTRGEHTTLEDVHDAWSLYTNTHRANHQSLVPFDELSPEVQELDRKYAEAIHEADARLHLRLAQMASA